MVIERMDRETVRENKQREREEGQRHIKRMDRDIEREWIEEQRERERH